MPDIPRAIAQEFGRNSYTTILLVLMALALIAARAWGVELLYGLAVVLAFGAGTGRRRTIVCEECEQAVEIAEV